MIKLNRSLTALALCAILALTPGGISRAAGKPTSTPLALPANDYSMGPAPRSCPLAESDLLHVAHNNAPNVVPHTYWWIGRGALDAYSGWLVHGRKVTLHFGVHTRYGYPQKVFFQSANWFHGTITLRGWDLRTHRPILFGLAYHPPVRVIRGGPANMIYVPSAGCYVIRAKWKSGSWSLTFAAGCVADRRMFGVAHCR